MSSLYGTAPVSQELRDYYKQKFGYEDVDFVLPHLEGSVDIGGAIILTQNNQTKKIEVDDAFRRGFDGIDGILKWYKEHWDE